MSSPWLAWPAGSDPRQLARGLERAHADFVACGAPGPPVREVVLSSWQRCADYGVDPDTPGPAPDLDDADLSAYRDAHPLAVTMPLVRRLLVEDALDADLVVAVADAGGRLLWVEGSSPLRTRAQRIGFVEGACWDERHAGTNAPGLALATRHAVQVFGREHFSRAVQPWSCSAAPIRDPRTGDLLGVIDVTGGDTVAAPQALSIVRSVAAAVERELLIVGAVPSALGGHDPEAGHGPGAAALGAPTGWRLELLGIDEARIWDGARERRLSRRHSEMVFLLCEHPRGLSAEQLDAALHPADSAVVTVRAEMSRLRRLLGEERIASRPYRLTEPWDTDVAGVRRLLDTGRIGAAAGRYPGPLLPGSEAPAVVSAREELQEHLRQSLLAGGDARSLLGYARCAEGRTDLVIWRAALNRLPARAPQRAEARAHLEVLERELGPGPAAATRLQPQRF